MIRLYIKVNKGSSRIEVINTHKIVIFKKQKVEEYIKEGVYETNLERVDAINSILHKYHVRKCFIPL